MLGVFMVHRSLGRGCVHKSGVDRGSQERRTRSIDKATISENVKKMAGIVCYMSTVS